MSSSERHTLRVRTDDEDASVSVLDARDREVGAGLAPLELELDAGLYTARVWLAGQVAETFVRLDGDRDLDLPAPLRRSPAPFGRQGRYGSSHEYYSSDAIRLSQQPTRGPIGGSGSYIMLFLRREDRGAAPIEGLFLVDAHGVRVAHASGSEVETDDRWIALSAEAAPGDYLLRYEGPGEPREMPLLLASGFRTYLFASVAADRELAGAHGPAYPRLEAASVVMGRGPFQPDDEVAMSADRALEVLSAGRGDVRGRGMQDLLDGKFDNPILGLLGLHVMLNREKPPPADLLEHVLRNLRGMLGDAAPDVVALEVRVAAAVGRAAQVIPLERPPLLRAGSEALLTAAVDRPDLIVAGSPLEGATVRALADSPWTSWAPEPQPLYAGSSSRADAEEQRRLYEDLGVEPEFEYVSRAPRRSSEPLDGVLEMDAFDAEPEAEDLDDAEEEGLERVVREPLPSTGPTPAWVQRAVFEAATTDVSELARQTGVAPRLIRQTLAFIDGSGPLRRGFEARTSRRARRRRQEREKR